MKASPLSKEERELWLLLESMNNEETFLEFIPTLTPKYVAPYHLRPFAEVLTRAWREPVRACTSLPPRHAKTETILHYIALTLRLHPEWTIAYVGYSTEFAESKSRAARDLAKKAGVKIREDAHRLGEWRTQEGGGLLAVGIGGPLTGHGCQILICDDVVKNREEASSELIRQRNYEWFTSTAATRVEPGGSIVVNMTRWAEDDLIGRICSDSETKFEVINLPAISDDGKALWPERWTIEALNERRKLVGEFDFWAMYQGQPRPKGGAMFLEPVRYDFPDVLNARFVIGVDPAATAKTSADYSAIVVLAAKGAGVNQVVDILEVWRGQVEIPRLVSHLNHLQKKWQCPVAIGAVGGFKAVPQMLREIDPSVRLIPVKMGGDKHTRALGVAAAWNDGRVRVPKQASWLPDFMSEVLKFSGVSDRHDDQVDALSHAFNVLTQTHSSVNRGAYIARNLPFG